MNPFPITWSTVLLTAAVMSGKLLYNPSRVLKSAGCGSAPWLVNSFEKSSGVIALLASLMSSIRVSRFLPGTAYVSCFGVDLENQDAMIRVFRVVAC